MMIRLEGIGEFQKQNTEVYCLRCQTAHTYRRPASTFKLDAEGQRAVHGAGVPPILNP